MKLQPKETQEHLPKEDGRDVTWTTRNPGATYSWRLPDEVVPLGGYRRHRVVLELSPPTSTSTL